MSSCAEQRTLFHIFSLFDSGTDLFFISLPSSRHECLVQSRTEIVVAKRILSAHVEEFYGSNGQRLAQRSVVSVAVS